MKKIWKTIWEYPIADKHPNLSLLLMATMMPFFLVIDMIYELITGKTIGEKYYEKKV